MKFQPGNKFGACKKTRARYLPLHPYRLTPAQIRLVGETYFKHGPRGDWIKPMANELGVAQQTVSHWAHGRRHPSEAHALLILALLPPGSA